jgi:two-component system CheB/CheR fusion protein
MDDAAPPPMPLPEDVAALRQRVAHLEAALTAQQHGAQALREAKDAAEQIVETVRDPLLVLTPDFRVQSANPAFYHLFQVRPTETVGQHIYHLGDGQWDIPALHTLLEEILPRETVFNDYEVTHDFERRLLLDSRVVIGQVGRNRLFLQAFHGGRDRCSIFGKSRSISSA